MKKVLGILVLSSLTLAPLSMKGEITIYLWAEGLLDGEESASSLLDGSLIQVITRTGESSGFVVPTPAGFVGEHENLLDSFALDGSSGYGENTGSFSRVLHFDLVPGSVEVGQELLLRWWPTLTLADILPSPGAKYGEYRTDLVVDDSEMAWIIPTDGLAPLLNFYADGTTGRASLQVVPEPSTYVLAGVIGLAGLIALRRRRS